MRRLFADIETSPNVVLAFSAGFNQTINHDAIIQERKIICIGYRWEWEKKARVTVWDEDQNDKKILQEFSELAEDADEIVGHYASRFDIPWIRTRCLIHKLPPIPLYKIVDTKSIASKYFYFNSNKLDYISRVLGHGGKLKTEFDLWKRILLDNDRDALKYMAKYCAIDVDRLADVYNDMKAYIRPETHVGVLHGGGKWCCSHCGSDNVVKSKTRVTASGTIQHQMKCVKCGGYHQISDSSFKEYSEYMSGKKGKTNDKKNTDTKTTRKANLPKTGSSRRSI